MNLPTQSLKHSLKTILGMIALAILVAGMVSSVSIGKAQAGKMSGGVRAAPATTAAKTGSSNFNHVADTVRPCAEALGGQGACALQAPLLQPVARSHALELIARSL